MATPPLARRQWAARAHGFSFGLGDVETTAEFVGKGACDGVDVCEAVVEVTGALAERITIGGRLVERAFDRVRGEA